MTTVALTMRVTDADGYHEPRDSISHDWLNTLRAWNMHPVLLPNAGAHAAEIFAETDLDLLILTGGEDIGRAPERDGTEKILLDRALENGTAVFGVCRGLQLINTVLGGRLDRVEGHVASDHAVTVAGEWAPFYGDTATINSFHNIAVPADGVGSGLKATAWDSSGNVEGLRHESKPLAAVMWHPERRGGHAGDLRLVQSLIETARSSA